MVFRKYKPAKQWGKMDTRIFKEIYNSRIARKMPSYEVPDAIKDLGVKVYDAKDPFLFEKQLKLENLEHKKPQTSFHNSEQHPLYNENQAFVFEGSEPLSDGIAQACLLTRSIIRQGLPEAVLHRTSKIEVSEEAVRDAIMHGERYDPTLEKLPERFDPVMFWVKHVRVHGTPVAKRNEIILVNLLRHIIFSGIRAELLGDSLHLQFNKSAPMSAPVNGGRYFSSTPFVLRGQPALTVQSLNQVVNLPWASEDEVKAASEERLPDISPLSPLIDLRKDNLYNTDTLLPRSDGRFHLHSIMWTREQSQKYPWTHEQNAANAIMHTFGAAVAQATRRGTPSSLAHPIMMRGVQLIDGKLDLVAFQLNSLKMEDENCKNIVWIEKGLRLYKSKPFYEQLESVEQLNMETVKKLVALVLGFGQLSSQ